MGDPVATPAPVQLKDKESGALVDVHPDQLGDAVNSGRYLVPEGTHVPVLDPDGSIRTLPVELISGGAAANAGIRVAGQADIDEWRKQKQYGEGVGNVVRATAEAGFNEAVVGAGDAALIASGVSTAEGIRERRARNEVASTIGGAGGIVLPILATMGAAAPEEIGGQVAGRGVLGMTGQALRLTPTALLARGGSAATKAVAKGLGGGFLARLTAAGLVSGAEGAVYGTGQALSAIARDGEDVLGDHETVAEYLLAHAEHGALIGGGVGIAGESLVSALGAGARGIKAGVQRFRNSDQLAAEASDVELRTAVRADAREQGLPAQDAERGLSVLLKQRKAYRELGETQDAAIRKIQALGDEAENAFDKAQGSMPISGKFRGVRDAIRSSDDFAPAPTVVEEGQTVVRKLQSSLREMVNDPDTRQASVAKSLLRYADNADLKFRKLEAALEKGPGVDKIRDTVFRSFAELDNLKRAVGAHRERLGGMADAGAGEISGTLAGKLVGSYGEIADNLENASLYGQKVSTIQVGDNRAWVPWFDVRNGYRRSFLAEGEQGGARSYDGFGNVPRQDPAKVSGVVRGILGPESSLRLELMARNFDSSAALLEQLAKSHQAGASTQKFVQRYREIAAQMVDQLGNVRRLSGDAAQFDALAKDFAGVPLVPSIAKAAVAVAERSKAITSIADVAQKIEVKVSAAVKGLTERLGTGAPGRAIVPAISGMNANESRREYYARRRQGVREMIADPTVIANRSVRLANPNYAPTIAAHVATKAATAADFLEGVGPRERTKSMLRPDLDKNPPVDEIEARKWLRYLHVVENPIAALDQMAKGDVTREAVDALRVVYPKMYERLLNDVVTKVSSLEKPPSMTESVQLSILFGVPLHFTMRPAFIQSYQRSFATQRQALAGAPRRSASGASQIAKNMATPFQRLEQ